jgi:hypothetical protein
MTAVVAELRVVGDRGALLALFRRRRARRASGGFRLQQQASSVVDPEPAPARLAC